MSLKKITPLVLETDYDYSITFIWNTEFKQITMQFHIEGLFAQLDIQKKTMGNLLRYAIKRDQKVQFAFTKRIPGDVIYQDNCLKFFVSRYAN